MEVIEQLKGTNGIIYLYNDRIVISRNTFGGFAAFGVAGDKTFFYNAIQGVELSGSILRVIPKGADTNIYNSISFLDVRKAQKDSNAILVGSKIELAKRICEIITKKVNETYSNVNFETTSSVADEILKFKKLLDEGIITQEEFETKKKELLK